MDELYQYLIKELIVKNIKHEIHKFDSGAVMVDVWYYSNFYCFQIEEDFVGFSKVHEGVDLSSIPDFKLHTLYDIKRALTSIWG